MRFTIQLLTLCCLALFCSICWDAQTAFAQVRRECNDRIDNDGDGFCDVPRKGVVCLDGSIPGDPDCNGRDTRFEATPECSDHKDNDGNGFCDHDGASSYCLDGAKPGDDGCNGKKDKSESSGRQVIEICDGIDNDRDGQIDEGGVCETVTCDDSKKNGGETDVDCGGDCADCGIGQRCTSNSDCSSDLCAAGICQTPPTTNLPDDCKAIKYDNGTVNNHINLVLVPSGFGSNYEAFAEQAQKVAAAFTVHEPFGENISKVNVLYVTKNSGSYCNFNCNGIDRLLCCDAITARGLSATCVSGNRQTVVIHNDTKYGGAGYRGGDMATTSINSLAPKVAVHEIGHSLFHLDDEYSYAGAPGSDSPNCDSSNQCSKWRDMLGYRGVGCVPNSCGGGNLYSGELSIMMDVDRKFEEVNLRKTCCVHYQETGEFPTYCEQFKQFAFSATLANFCSAAGPMSALSTARAPKVVVDNTKLEQPVELEFARSKKTGEWKLVKQKRAKAGYYRKSQIEGDKKGAIEVQLQLDTGKNRSYAFEDVESVEIPPADGKRLGGYSKVKRDLIRIVVDREKAGKPVSVKIRKRK